LLETSSRRLGVTRANSDSFFQFTEVLGI